MPWLLAITWCSVKPDAACRLLQASASTRGHQQTVGPAFGDWLSGLADAVAA